MVDCLCPFDAFIQVDDLVVLSRYVIDTSRACVYQVALKVVSVEYRIKGVSWLGCWGGRDGWKEGMKEGMKEGRKGGRDEGRKEGMNEAGGADVKMVWVGVCCFGCGFGV